MPDLLMTSEETKEYTFNFLHEEVADQDLYEDQTHENVAVAMHRFIQINEDRGLTIGLEGSWGAGKSTVIHLLKNKIRAEEKAELKNPKTLFFLFDAWAHEGDPLRRVFLESLIEEASGDEANAKFETIKSKLKGEHTEKRTSRHRTTSLAFWLSASSLLIPVGVTLLKSTSYSLPWEGSASSEVNVTALLGGVLATLPTLGIFPYTLYRFFTLETASTHSTWVSKIKDKLKKFRKDFSKTFSLVTGARNEEYTTVISTNNDKTSLEFERYFNEILQYTLGGNEDCNYDKAILIIDNLDRIDEVEALRIWSNLQAFFQHRNGNLKEGEEWKKKIWFIVPHDREAIQKLWEASPVKKGDLNEEDNPDTIGHTKTSCAFLDKCFQVRFEVPEPVLSAWQGYLEDQVERAFETWSLEKRNEVILAFERCHSKLNHSPKPREIRNFINQVGALMIQWKGKVSAEIIAIYVCLRHAYGESGLREKLLKCETVDAIEASQPFKSIAPDIAGLLFGVTPSKGMEILLGPEIKKAAFGGKDPLLEDLVGKHKRAFWIAWRGVYKELVNGSKEKSHKLTIQATQRIASIYPENKKDLASAKKQLAHRWLEMCSDEWNLENDYTLGIESLSVIYDPNTRMWSVFARKIKRELVGIVEAILATDDRRGELFEQIERMAKQMKANGHPIEHQQLPILDAQKWDSWVAVLDEHQFSNGIIEPAEGVISQFVNEIPVNNQVLNEQKMKSAIRAIDEAPDSEKWTEIVSRLAQWMTRNQRNPNHNDLVYTLCRKLIQKLPIESVEQFKSSIKHQHFWIIASRHQIESHRDIFLLSFFAYEGSIATSCPSQHVKDFWTKEVEEEDLAILSQSIKSLDLQRWIPFIAKAKTSKLAHALLLHNFDDSSLFEEPFSHDMLPAYAEWAIDDEGRECLDAIASEICEHCDISSFGDEMTADKETWAETLFHLGSCGHKDAISVIKPIIENLTVEEWTKAFNENLYFLDCALFEWVTLDHKYSDVFHDIIEQAIEEDNNVNEWIWENFDGLLGASLSPDKWVRKITLKYFSNVEDALTDEAFEALKPFFKKEHSKSKVSNKLDLINEWMKNNQNERLEWILGLKSIKTCKAPEDLISRLQEWLESGDQAKEGIAEKIVSQYKLTKQMKKPKKASDESE